MHKTAATGLAALAFSGLAMADAHIDLGDAQRVTRLFAFPNNCHVICYRDWTLEQTVEHYLTQSVRRDGYANAQVNVSRDHDRLRATISDVGSAVRVLATDPGAVKDFQAFAKQTGNDLLAHGEMPDKAFEFYLKRK